MEQNETGQNQTAPAAGSVTDEIREPAAQIHIEGQEFELDAMLAADDRTLKTVLQPHFASLENANINRTVKDGKLHVTIVKKAQHKGAGNNFGYRRANAF